MLLYAIFDKEFDLGRVCQLGHGIIRVTCASKLKLGPVRKRVFRVGPNSFISHIVVLEDRWAHGAWLIQNHQIWVAYYFLWCFAGRDFREDGLVWVVCVTWISAVLV